MNNSTSSNGFVHSKVAQLVNIAIKGMAVTVLTVPLMLTASAEENKKKEEIEQIEQITVTGIRGSLAKATEVKRTLDVVADVISGTPGSLIKDGMNGVIDSIQKGFESTENNKPGKDI